MAIVSSETLIIFIAAVLVASSVAGVMTSGVSEMSAAMDDRSDDVATEIRTDIDIISDAGSDAVVEGSTVTLLVKNTGSETLNRDPDAIDVLINGQYQSSVDTQVVGPDDQWRPGAVLKLTVEDTDLQSSNRAVVLVNGNRETFEFRAT